MSTVADISLERRGGALVVALRGEVDMTNASFVREELTSAVSNDDRALIIDLSGTRYLDSAAIEALFELSRRLSRRRQELRLVVPVRSPLKRLLDVCDVETVARMHEDLESALPEYPASQ